MRWPLTMPPPTNNLTEAFKNLGSEVKEFFSKVEPLQLFVLIFNFMRTVSIRTDASNTWTDYVQTHVPSPMSVVVLFSLAHEHGAEQ